MTGATKLRAWIVGTVAGLVILLVCEMVFAVIARAQPLSVPPVPSDCPSGSFNRWSAGAWHCEPGGGGGAAVCIPDGAVKATCASGGCAIYKEDCTTLATPGSTTSGLQEAFTYAWVTNKLPFRVRGSGTLTFANVTLNIPAQLGLPFDCWGPRFQFNNTAQDGMVFDTQVKSIWDMWGCRISYSGTGRAVLQQPRTFLPYIPSQGPTPWTADVRFNFGVIEATGGTPEALFAIDVRQVLGTLPSGFDSAEFAANKVSISALEGNGFSTFNFRAYPALGPLQVIGQNFFDLGYVQWATLDEIYIGDWQGSTYVGVGTNHYTAHLAHWSPVVGSRAIVSNGYQERWQLSSLNNYSGTTVGSAVYWGPQAQGNRIITTQLIGWTQPSDPVPQMVAWPNVICGYSAAAAC